MSTEIKTIKGFAGGKRTGYMPEKKNVTVRFTSDEYGETMSIEDGEIMQRVFRSCREGSADRQGKYIWKARG